MTDYGAANLGRSEHNSFRLSNASEHRQGAPDDDFLEGALQDLEAYASERTMNGGRPKERKRPNRRPQSRRTDATMLADCWRLCRLLGELDVATLAGSSFNST